MPSWEPHRCGQHERTARLRGAADAAREASRHPRFPQFHLFSQTEETVRIALGSDRFRADWDAGWEIPIEDVVAAARAVFTEKGCYL